MKTRLTDTLAQIRETSGVIGTVSREMAAAKAPESIGEGTAGNAFPNARQGSPTRAEALQVQAARLAEAARFLRPAQAKAVAVPGQSVRTPGPNVVSLRPRLTPMEALPGGCGGSSEWEAS
jgi:hypothetical protein